MNDHDDLASVFEAYRTTAARSFMPADAETIYHAAHTRKTRRMTVTAATALLVTGLFSAGLMLKAPEDVDHHPPVISQSPNPVYPTSPSIPPSSTPSPARPGAEPATGPEPGNQVRFINEQTVGNDPPASTVEQRRRYHWNGTRFVQNGGPTSFPPNLPPDVRDVDLRNSYFQLSGSPEDFIPCGGGLLSFVDTRSGTWPYRDRDFPESERYPAAAFELGEISGGVLAVPEPPATRGSALITVRCRQEGSGWETWLVYVTDAKAVGVLKVGTEGVTGFVSHRIVDGVAELIVTTRTGPQTWRFRSDGNTLVRIP